MGCIYSGMRVGTVNAVFKIGQTSKDTPTERWTSYSLNPLGYVLCPNATQAELLFLEAVARLACERIGMMPHKTDFFKYRMDKPNCLHEAITLSDKLVLTEVIKACEDKNIPYTYHKVL